MNVKLLAILVCLMLFFSFAGKISSLSLKKKSIEYNPFNPEFTHTVLGEVFVKSSDVPCKYLHQALKQLYAQELYPFYYILYLFDKNNNSNDRKNELGVTESPTIVFDGGYEQISLVLNNTEEWLNKLNESFFGCGGRDVKDIDLSLDVEWLGAVNPSPPDGETSVRIESCIIATVTEMKIDVEVTNNEESEYDGHLHVQITENESEWWDDKFGNPYTHEFKDYAYNNDVTLSADETFSGTIYWDGCDYNDGDYPPRYFDHIIQDNILVIASVFDNDNNEYIDDVVGVHTGGFHAGAFYDPKTFDIYFGETNPPPKVLSNGTRIIYCPAGDLNWSTTYYWKVDVINNLDEIIPGEVWSFTTRGNSPPNTPTPVFPTGGAENISICFSTLEWNCSDPDGDNLTYDIYFGESNNPPLVENNWSGNSYDLTPHGQNFEFNKTYYWKIVAWDPYGESATGGIWEFRTEKNLPPNPAYNPRPPNGANRVPVNVVLYWNGSDPNLCDTLTYDVYFGLYEPPSIQSHNQSKSEYDPYGPNGDLQINEIYYWKIVTWDKSGDKSESPTWTFSTDPPCVPPPPEIDGPTQGESGVIYEFNFVSHYFDNSSIIYEIEWGDGKMIEYGPYEYGEVITLNHSWDTRGTFIIKARTKDEYGVYSHWSYHEIVIPRGRNVVYIFDLLSLLYNRFPILLKFLYYFKVI
jgi:hypothetical protein